MIGPEERLPWGQTLVVGLQHVFAMFGATVLVPILVGFDPNISIFFPGIGNIGVGLGGIIAAGALYAAIGLIVMATGAVAVYARGCCAACRSCWAGSSATCYNLGRGSTT